MENRIPYLRGKAMKLPLRPGVYLMKNKQGGIIYVGKAKALKNRVSQYFGSGSGHTRKVQKMVENVYDFDTIICENEFEALVLECSLIKQHRPKYNILLKDDKGYCFIKITDEPFRRLKTVYRKEDDGGTYIGPYLSTAVINESVDAANKIFCLSSCERQIPSKGYDRRPCLNYYIHQCTAPCCGKIGKIEYNKRVDDAIDFLKGGTKEYLDQLEETMERYSENLEFEKAAEIRDRISAIRKLESRQQVIFSGNETWDIISMARDDEQICFHVLRFEKGKLTGSEDHITEIDETLEHTRSEFIKRYYILRDNIPERVVIDDNCEDTDLIESWLSEKAGRKVELFIPKQGRPLRLMQMSKNNAYKKLGELKQRGKPDSAVIELGELLMLDSPPVFIESYDISHTAGSDPVGAMIVFKNGVPYKRGYRKFIIKEAQGGDDYGAMEEVLRRRFLRYIKERENSGDGFGRLPNLILMDGGLGQVHIAEKVLKDLELDVPVFGMVKDDKHRTRGIISDEGEITLSRTRKVYTLVTGIQDEVHRSAIQYHHKRHSEKARHSELTDVPGIGPKKAEKLWREFRTIEAIKRADIDTLSKVKGISVGDAVNIKKYFNHEI